MLAKNVERWIEEWKAKGKAEGEALACGLSLSVLLTVSSSACYNRAQNDNDTETGSCVFVGQTRRVGESFPAADGRNTCSCGDNGGVALGKSTALRYLSAPIF